MTTFPQHGQASSLLGETSFIVGFTSPKQGLSHFCEDHFFFSYLWKAFSFSDKWNLKLNDLLQKQVLVPFPPPLPVFLSPAFPAQLTVGAQLKKPHSLSVALHSVIAFRKLKSASSVKCVCLGNFHSINLPGKSSWRHLCLSPHFTHSSGIVGQSYPYPQCAHKLIFQSEKKKGC